MFRLAQKEHLIVPAHVDHLANLRDFVIQIGRKYGFSRKLVNAFKLAIDEAATNIIENVYSENEGYITIQAIIKRKSLTINLIDQGTYFDPMWSNETDVRENMALGKKGDLGIFMMRKLLDNIEYKKTNSGNRLSLTKHDRNRQTLVSFNRLWEMPPTLRLKYFVHAILLVTLVNVAGFATFYYQAENHTKQDVLQLGKKLTKQISNQISAVDPSLVNGPDGLAYVHGIATPIYTDNAGIIYSVSLEDSLGYLCWSTVPAELTSKFVRPGNAAIQTKNAYSYTRQDNVDVFEFERELALQPGKSAFKKVHVFLTKTYVDNELQLRRLRYMKTASISLGASYILLALLSYVISHPLRKLNEWVRATRHGNLTNDLDIDESSEIGELALAFSDITHELQQTREHLAKNEQLEREIKVAQDIQEALLPDKLPEPGTLEITAHYEAASAVSGDYYDFIEVDQDHLGVVVADVSGKGVPGSLVMTMIRTALRTEARGLQDAAEVLRRVNELLKDDLKNGVFVTVLYLIINTKNGIINFANAGHTPLIIHRGKTNKTYYLNPGGFPVGLQVPEPDDFSASIKSEKVRIEETDTVLLYTDGVTEEMNRDQEIFGKERLLQVIQKYHKLPLKAFSKKLRHSIYSFREDLPLHDDITFVAVRPTAQLFEAEHQPDSDESCLDLETRFLSQETATRILDIVSDFPEYDANDISFELMKKQYGETKVEPGRIQAELMRRDLATRPQRKQFAQFVNANNRHLEPPAMPKLTLADNFHLGENSKLKPEPTKRKNSREKHKKGNALGETEKKKIKDALSSAPVQKNSDQADNSLLAPDIEADFVFGDFIDELISSTKKVVQAEVEPDKDKPQANGEQTAPAATDVDETAEMNTTAKSDPDDTLDWFTESDLSDSILDSIFDNYSNRSSSEEAAKPPEKPDKSSKAEAPKKPLKAKQKTKTEAAKTSRQIKSTKAKSANEGELESSKAEIADAAPTAPQEPEATKAKTLVKPAKTKPAQDSELESSEAEIAETPPTAAPQKPEVAEVQTPVKATGTKPAQEGELESSEAEITEAPPTAPQKPEVAEVQTPVKATETKPAQEGELESSETEITEAPTAAPQKPEVAEAKTPLKPAEVKPAQVGELESSEAEITEAPTLAPQKPEVAEVQTPVKATETKPAQDDELESSEGEITEAQPAAPQISEALETAVDLEPAAPLPDNEIRQPQIDKLDSADSIESIEIPTDTAANITDQIGGEETAQDGTPAPRAPGLDHSLFPSFDLSLLSATQPPSDKVPAEKADANVQAESPEPDLPIATEANEIIEAATENEAIEPEEPLVAPVRSDAPPDVEAKMPPPLPPEISDETRSKAEQDNSSQLFDTAIDSLFSQDTPHAEFDETGILTSALLTETDSEIESPAKNEETFAPGQLLEETSDEITTEEISERPEERIDWVELKSDEFSDKYNRRFTRRSYTTVPKEQTPTQAIVPETPNQPAQSADTVAPPLQQQEKVTEKQIATSEPQAIAPTETHEPAPQVLAPKETESAQPAGMDNEAGTTLPKPTSDDTDAAPTQSAKQPVEDLHYFVNCGISAYKKREFEDAIMYFKKALRIDPKFSDAHAMLGNAYFRNNMLNEALQSYQILRESGKADASVHENIGIIYWRLGIPEAAADAWRAVLKSQPQRQDIAKRIQLIEQQQKRSERATISSANSETDTLIPESTTTDVIAAETKPATNGNSAATTLIKHGIESYKRQDHEAAIGMFKKAILQFPDKPQGYRYLGTAYFKNRMYNEAAEVFERLKELDKKDLRLKENLALIRVKQGDYKQAVQEWQEILEFAPERQDVKRKIEKLQSML